MSSRIKTLLPSDTKTFAADKGPVSVKARRPAGFSFPPPPTDLDIPKAG